MLYWTPGVLQMNEQLKTQILDYSTSNGYIAEHFASPVCSECGCDTLKIVMNEDEGVAARTCTACNHEHGMGDSDDYFDEVEEVVRVICTCDSEQFRIMAGIALYADSEDVRWFYLGCECVSCGLSGVYADWKNEFPGYREFLKRV